MKALSFLLDCLFPKFCFLCKKEGKYLCNTCRDSIPFREGKECALCGKYSLDMMTLCSTCIHSTSLVDLYIATEYRQKPMSKLIRSFKYSGVSDLQKHCGMLLSTYAKQIGCVTQDQIIIPVPLHKKRLRMRGFNQAEMLAHAIEQTFGNVCNTQVLQRVSNTPPQSTLSGKIRIQNVKNAYICTQNMQNAHILLIDDVVTTGATLSACANTLKKNGASEVKALVLSKA